MNEIIEAPTREVFAPGIYDGISNEAYHASEGISRSEIVTINKTIAHYVDSKREKKKTGSMNFGSYVHDLLMYPDLLDSYALEPNFDRRTKLGKEAYREWLKYNKDKIIIPKDVCKDHPIKEATEKILANIEASDFLKKFLNQDYCKFEQAIYWVDELTGELCKCKPDILAVSGDTAFYFEIKTCQDASYAAFRWDVKKWKHHVQGSFYSEGIAQGLKAVGISIKEVIVCFVAIEVQSPYCIGVYDIDQATLDKSRQIWQKGLRKFKEYKENKKVIGYPEKVRTISLSDREIE